MRPDPTEFIMRRIRRDGGLVIDDTSLTMIKPVTNEEQRMVDQLRKDLRPET